MHGQHWGTRVLEETALDWLEAFDPWARMGAAPLSEAQKRLGDDAPDTVMALTIEDRRRSERDLLEEYRDALGLPADELPSLREI